MEQTSSISPGSSVERHLQGSCDCEVFERLEQIISKPQFLQTLEITASQCPARPVGPGSSVGSSAVPRGRSHLDTSDIEDEFVVVESEDAIESMAYYLAQCISACPEAHALPPKKLQEALTMTIKSLKQSKFKQMLSMGRYAYRWSALTYSALQMYQNPWLVQVVVRAVWMFSRMGLRLIL